MTKVLLEPNSLLVLKEAGRFEWRHGISRSSKFVPLREGGTITRDENYRRVSITIRHLLDSRRVVVSKQN